MRNAILVTRSVRATSLYLAFTANVFAAGCYESSITSPSPFMGNNDEIFKLDDGSVWQVKYEYEYLYEYYPPVTICPDIGKLLIDGKSLQVVRISSPSGDASPPSSSTEPAGSTVIESYITSEFDGLDHGNIYKLANGQVWEQAEAWIWVWVWVQPKVLIWNDGGIYRMKVEGIDHSVAVRRIK